MTIPLTLVPMETPAASATAEAAVKLAGRPAIPTIARAAAQPAALPGGGPTAATAQVRAVEMAPTLAKELALAPLPIQTQEIGALGGNATHANTAHEPLVADAPNGRRLLRRPPRRVPWWLRRALRAWGRAARACQALGGARSGAGRWVVLEADPAPEHWQEVHERRCGWFDSSQDLREGLQISEHGQDAAAAAELPVMAWVQWQLSGWRPSLDASAP